VSEFAESVTDREINLAQQLATVQIERDRYREALERILRDDQFLWARMIAHHALEEAGEQDQ
jgi:maltodextrin utilization protein YvdJ